MVRLTEGNVLPASQRTLRVHRVASAPRADVQRLGASVRNAKWKILGHGPGTNALTRLEKPAVPDPVAPSGTPAGAPMNSQVAIATGTCEARGLGMAPPGYRGALWKTPAAQRLHDVLPGAVPRSGTGRTVNTIVLLNETALRAVAPEPHVRYDAALALRQRHTYLTLLPRQRVGGFGQIVTGTQVRRAVPVTPGS